MLSILPISVVRSETRSTEGVVPILADSVNKPWLIPVGFVFLLIRLKPYVIAPSRLVAKLPTLYISVFKSA